ncbi:MAG TPA: sugar transferase, partial [Acidimicrobiales bacterium]|nr:sugar transferase [Acidimicrobiales bacterium]
MTVIEQSATVQFGRVADLSVVPPRTRRMSHSAWPILVACDSLAMALAFLVGSSVRILLTGPSEGPGVISVSLLREAPYALVFLAAMSMYGFYGRTRRRVQRSWFLDFGQLAHSLVTGSVAIAALSSGLYRFVGLPKIGWVEVGALAAPALLLVPVIRGGGSMMSRHHGVRRLRVAVVGCGPAADRLLRRLQRIADMDLVGLVTESGQQEEHPAAVLGPTAELLQICRYNAVDRIFVSSNGLDASQLEVIIRGLPPEVHVLIVPTFADLLTWQTQVEDLDGLTIMEVPPAELGLVRRGAKRTLDVAVSSAALILLSPLLAAIAVSIKISSPGPVFFRQERIGYRGKPFFVLKFRTMCLSAEAAKQHLWAVNECDGPMFKIRSDPRVTPVGGVLRRTSLDELPQLIN